MPYLVNRSTRRSGFVLLIMAFSAFAMFGVLGLAVDIGRMYIVKNETQTFCDAASLAAAAKLDGMSSGITNAQNAVTNSGNTWNFNTASISAPQVDFATAITGPWTTNPPNPPTNYLYVRVQTTAPVSLYFLPFVVPQTSQNVPAIAIAAQIPQTGFKKGLAPYTAVVQDSTGKTSNFGFVVGNEYDLQWPAYNGSKSGCNAGNPDNCFVKPTCKNDSKSAKSLVVTNWGASFNGYWGSNANSVIYQEVLNVLQLQPVNIGDNLPMASGNKAAQATALDTRVNEDGDTNNGNSISEYLNNQYHNGRRLVAVPIVTPEIYGGTQGYSHVEGYGAFLLESDSTGPGNQSSYYAKNSGNEGFCAIYAGPYVQGSSDPGASGSTGAYKVLLVQ